jgi:osmotically-inducible protein OsmY
MLVYVNPKFQVELMSKTNTLEKTDSQLKTDVLSELKYDPSVHYSDIGVLVKDGTVTLNGSTSSYSQKWEAVRAAKRVAGVEAIADEIEVKFSNSLNCSDADIATAAAYHIDWFTTIPKGSVKVTVSDGWITLDGDVEWQYLKNAAGHFLPHISGVKGISNLIAIKPKLAKEVKADIESAFKRNSMLDANKIKVETVGSDVTLSGEVRNYAEREEAERVAWDAPGTFSVNNELMVKWFDYIS